MAQKLRCLLGARPVTSPRDIAFTAWSTYALEYKMHRMPIQYTCKQSLQPLLPVLIIPSTATIASIASTHSLVPWHDNTPLPSCIEFLAPYITRKHSIWQCPTTIIEFTFHSSALDKSRNSCGLINQQCMPPWNKNSNKYRQKTIRSSLAWPVHEMFAIWLMRLAMMPLPNPLSTAG